MGWWPSKLIVILNLIQMLGYCLIDSVVGGQILSAVSPHGNMSVAVGALSTFHLSSSSNIHTDHRERNRDYRHHHLGYCYVWYPSFSLL